MVRIKKRKSILTDLKSVSKRKIRGKQLSQVKKKLNKYLIGKRMTVKIGEVKKYDE